MKHRAIWCWCRCTPCWGASQADLPSTGTCCAAWQPLAWQPWPQDPCRLRQTSSLLPGEDALHVRRVGRLLAGCRQRHPCRSAGLSLATDGWQPAACSQTWACQGICSERLSQLPWGLALTCLNGRGFTLMSLVRYKGAMQICHASNVCSSWCPSICDCIYSQARYTPCQHSSTKLCHYMHVSPNTAAAAAQGQGCSQRARHHHFSHLPDQAGHLHPTQHPGICIRPQSTWRTPGAVSAAAARAAAWAASSWPLCSLLWTSWASLSRRQVGVCLWFRVWGFATCSGCVDADA